MYSFISALFFKTGLFFGCDGSSLLHTSFSLVSVSGSYSSRTPHCSGFSCETQAPGTWASVAAVRGIGSCSLHALECRLSSRGAWCSCSAAGGVFPDQEWNRCALRHKVVPAGPPGEPGAFDVVLNSSGLFLLIFHKFLTLGTQTKFTKTYQV